MGVGVQDGQRQCAGRFLAELEFVAVLHALLQARLPRNPCIVLFLASSLPAFLRKSVTRCACVQRLDFSAMSFPPDEEMPLVSDPYPTFRDPPQLTVRLRAAATS